MDRTNTSVNTSVRGFFLHQFPLYLRQSFSLILELTSEPQGDICLYIFSIGLEVCTTRPYAWLPPPHPVPFLGINLRSLTCQANILPTELPPQTLYMCVCVCVCVCVCGFPQYLLTFLSQVIVYADLVVNIHKMIIS